MQASIGIISEQGKLLRSSQHDHCRYPTGANYDGGRNWDLVSVHADIDHTNVHHAKSGNNNTPATYTTVKSPPPPPVYIPTHYVGTLHASTLTVAHAMDAISPDYQNKMHKISTISSQQK